MVTFISSEKFRLELKWAKPFYLKEGECSLEGAFFTGPVLQVAQKINENDFMMLDFYSQYVSLVHGVYVGKFSWGEVIYSDDGTKVFLKNAVLSHNSELNNVPKLEDNDCFVIDTGNHTMDQHNFNMLYKTILVNTDNYLYRFGKNE
jgi:hypothetical protein